MECVEPIDTWNAINKHDAAVLTGVEFNNVVSSSWGVHAATAGIDWLGGDASWKQSTSVCCHHAPHNSVLYCGVMLLHIHLRSHVLLSTCANISMCAVHHSYVISIARAEGRHAAEQLGHRQHAAPPCPHEGGLGGARLHHLSVLPPRQQVSKMVSLT